MCGICGLVALDGGEPPKRELIADMAATLWNRGPDSGGEHIDALAGIGARRLSIIDLAGGDQPISNEDGTVHVVQNGEIYNYAELRDRLRAAGHEFSTGSDTEVIVHLYEEHGADFARELRGMFAIAVWDERRRAIVLARDRFGIKPLVYGFAGRRLAFASELKALLRVPGLDREVDLDAVEAYLAFNSIPAPLTILRSARKLPPGHTLTWTGGEPELRRYARPRPSPAAALRTESAEALAAELRDRLRDSVRAHLVADVPVGVLLSGGVDSAALAALAAEEGPGRLKTFSIGFEERSFNELDRARMVARRYGTDHHELIVRPDAVELLPKIATSFDEPFGDSSALPTYLVSELAAGSVKVALSGEGGDELFGGYYTYAADLLAARVGGFTGLARPLVERLPSSSRKASLDYRLKRFVRAAGLPPLERHHGWKEIFSADARAELAGEATLAASDPVDLLRERYAETEGAEELARLQDVDLGIYLVDDLLVKTDRASMAHSLEARVPFLDQAVADLALALPRHLRVRGMAKKRLLRRAMGPLVPREIVRGRKQGFSAPVAGWLRNEVRSFARDTLSATTLGRQGLFDPAVVRSLLERHERGEEDLSRQIWGLLCFTLWFDRYMRDAPRASA